MPLLRHREERSDAAVQVYGAAAAMSPPRDEGWAFCASASDAGAIEAMNA